MARREQALESQGLTAMNKFLQRPNTTPNTASTVPVDRSLNLNGLKSDEALSNNDSRDASPTQPHSAQNSVQQEPDSERDGSERVEELQYLVASLETEMTSRIMALNVLTENIRSVRAEVRKGSLH